MHAPSKRHPPTHSLDRNRGLVISSHLVALCCRGDRGHWALHGQPSHARTINGIVVLRIRCMYATPPLNFWCRTLDNDAWHRQASKNISVTTSTWVRRGSLQWRTEPRQHVACSRRIAICEIYCRRLLFHCRLGYWMQFYWILFFHEMVIKWYVIVYAHFVVS